MKRLIIFAAGALVAASALAENNDAAAPAADVAAVSSSLEDLRLNIELKVGTNVENREVVGESAAFGPEVPKIVAWTRVSGANQPVQITHIWKRDGKTVATVPLNIQSASYRTFSRRTVAGEPGAWSVDVIDPIGKVVARKEFTVEP